MNHLYGRLYINFHLHWMSVIVILKLEVLSFTEIWNLLMFSLILITTANLEILVWQEFYITTQVLQRHLLAHHTICHRYFMLKLPA